MPDYLPSSGVSRQVFTFVQSNVSGSATNQLADSAQNVLRARMPRAGSIISITTNLNANPTAGSCTVKAQNNGVDIVGCESVLAGGAPGDQYKTVTFASGLHSFIVGTLLGMAHVADGAWLPASVDGVWFLEVEWD